MAAQLTQLAFLAGVIVIAILLWHRRRNGRNTGSLWRSGRSYRPWDQEAQLLQLCHGDRELVDRLITHELERSPNLSRAGAALAAATRLRHDKR